MGAMATNDGKILSRDFVLLFAINLIAVIVQFLFLTTMAQYAIQHFHVDGAVGGITASIFMIGAVVGRILSAHYANVFNLRKLCTLSIIGQLVFCVAYFASDIGIAFLIAVRLAHGLTFGVVNTVVPALAVDSLPEDRIGEGTGYFLLSTSLGVGVGPLMSILTAMGLDYMVLFVLASVLSAVAVAMSFFVKPSRVERAARAELEAGKRELPAKQPWGLGSIIDLSTVRISFFMFLIGFACSSLNSFASAYAAELDMAFFAPFIFLVYSITLIVTRPIAGKLMDRYGENVVLYPSIISMGVGCALAACAFNPGMLVACGIFMATGFGICMSVGQAVAVKNTKSGNTALVISTFFLLNDIGIGLGPFFLGFIVAGAGYRMMYWQCVVVAVIAVIYYHFSHGRKANG